jgi:hypothetical protein
MSTAEPTYTPLHAIAGGDDTPVNDELLLQTEETLEDNDYNEEDENDDDVAHRHKHHFKKEVLESFDFNDVESVMWRKVFVMLNENVIFVNCIIHFLASISAVLPRKREILDCFSCNHSMEMDTGDFDWITDCICRCLRRRVYRSSD